MALIAATVTLDLAHLAFGAAALLALVAGAWWMWNRHLAAGRLTMRRLSRLGEDLGAGIAVDTLRRLRAVLPGALRITDVEMYLVDHASHALRRVEGSSVPGSSAMPILMDDPVGFREKTMALCFRNRSMVAVQDARRSPFRDGERATPRSVLFAPMLAQNDLVGILEISHSTRIRAFSEPEQTAAQHIADEAAIGMRLREEKALRERTAGGDEAEATGRVMADAAGKLERRLSEVEASAKRLLSHGGGGRIEAELTRISGQAQKGIADVAQLLDFLKSRERESRSADLVSLLRGLARVGESEGNEAGSQTLDLLGEEPVIVAARPSYLERVFSSLLWYARDAVAGQTDKVVTLRVARLASRGEVGIWWPGPPHESDGGDLLEREHSPAEDVLGLAACRSLIRSCGGELSLVSDLARGWCFDIELPLAPTVAPPPASETASPARALTPLLVLVEDTDPQARQSLISLLGDKGQRALPAASMEEAIELVKRIHFNALFCSAQGLGASWIDCFSRARNHVDAFVVLSPGHDPALSAALPPGVAYALAKPVEPDELTRLLEQIGARIGKPSR